MPRYDAIRLGHKLRTKCSIISSSSTIFDWKTLGIEAGSCFNAVPPRVSFLSGPIQTEFVPKQRKKIERRKKEEEDVEDEEPEEVQQKSKNKTDEDKLSAVEKQMKVISFNNTLMSVNFG